MRQARYWIILLPLFLVLACVGAFAQANSELTGVVTDQMGAVVGGANVTLTDPATGTVHTTVSSGAGLYDFAGLNPALYNLKVTAKGFQNFVQTGIVVNVSMTFTVNVKLTVGSDVQTVNVVADALTVQTDSNVVSTLISSEEVTSIATENRNFAALAALGLGVSSELPDSNALGAFGSSWSIEFNGLREAHNIWLIDGGESADRGGGGGMQILPAQEAIAEFQVMTSNYPPDYGISSGATISISLKSGTKAFHGAAWEDNRATAYNANYFFNKYNGATGARPATHYNVYGFDAGGPIFIPHTFNSNKNKAFFFFSQEWRKTSGVSSNETRTIDPADIPNTTNVVGGYLNYVLPSYAGSQMPNNNSAVVPAVPTTSYYYNNQLTSQGLTGAQSGPPGNPQGYPITGTPGPGNCWNGNTSWVLKPGWTGPITPAAYSEQCTGIQKIPEVLFDGGTPGIGGPAGNTVGGTLAGNSAIYLSAGPLPLPNEGAGIDKNYSAIPIPQKVEDTVIRGDYNINDKWALLVHYIGDHQNQTYGQPELGWCGCDYRTLQSILSSPAHSATAKLTGQLKPNLLLEASMNYDGNGADIVPSANTFLPSDWTVQPVVAAYAITRKIWPGMGWGNTLGQSEDTATEPYHNAAQDYSPKADLSYTTGKHQMKFGFSYNRYTKNQMLYGDSQGYYNWGNLTGDTLMDTLLGLSSSYNQNLAAPIRHYANQTPSVYARVRGQKCTSADRGDGGSNE